MKRIFAVLFIVALAALSNVAIADNISFIWDTSTGETLQGVDGDTSGWSHNNSMVSLGTFKWGLLGDTAEVVARVGGSRGILTHRGTRGLGIRGGENDEIDSYYGDVERLVIRFDQPTYLNSFEVRSLFYEDDLLGGDHRERGVAKFWLGGDNIFTQRLVGVENIETPGTKGIVDYSYDTPYLIDKIVFRVPTDRWFTCQSEFSVAKLNVTAVPEPISTVLFLTGGTVLAIRRMRKKGEK